VHDPRCEIDPALRTPATWTYRAFYVGNTGTVLDKSRLVNVERVKRSTASAP
jgi:hypothetical protein